MWARSEVLGVLATTTADAAAAVADLVRTRNTEPKYKNVLRLFLLLFGGGGGDKGVFRSLGA